MRLQSGTPASRPPPLRPPDCHRLRPPTAFWASERPRSPQPVAVWRPERPRLRTAAGGSLVPGAPPPTDAGGSLAPDRPRLDRRRQSGARTGAGSPGAPRCRRPERGRWPDAAGFAGSGGPIELPGAPAPRGPAPARRIPPIGSARAGRAGRHPAEVVRGEVVLRPAGEDQLDAPAERLAGASDSSCGRSASFQAVRSGPRRSHPAAPSVEAKAFTVPTRARARAPETTKRHQPPTRPPGNGSPIPFPACRRFERI